MTAIAPEPVPPPALATSKKASVSANCSVVPDSLDDFIGIFTGYLGAELVDFTHAVALRFLIADEDAVVEVGLDGGQAAQVGDIGIDGIGAGDDIESAQAAGPFIKTGKLIGDSAAALPEANNN